MALSSAGGVEFFKQHDVVRVLFFTRAQRAFFPERVNGRHGEKRGFFYTMHHVHMVSVSD